MPGHLIGASGALGAMTALLALRHGTPPATRNLDELDPRVQLDVVHGEPRTDQWSVVRRTVQLVRLRRPQRQPRPHQVTPRPCPTTAHRRAPCDVLAPAARVIARAWSGRGAGPPRRPRCRPRIGPRAW
ncbi:hypothetical protein OYE22_16195 [Streptomyces sp. 71268]|uniref:hypothetical protein n=1 Tax=Streptomyces sp. 71268 TaxID=3002640 RepID=UPI0023F9AB5C|nr:hypothetical protein [Streptomyces sp. 71268]WEV29799.1 hypothetical protein OYE22_16195 [Streptomyces sp. 71268]